MTIPEMVMIARQAWREANPAAYQALEAAGQLQSETEAAARLTQMEMQTLMYNGAMTEAEAWEASRHLFIFKTEKMLRDQYYDLVNP